MMLDRCHVPSAQLASHMRCSSFASPTRAVRQVPTAAPPPPQQQQGAAAGPTRELTDAERAKEARRKSDAARAQERRLLNKEIAERHKIAKYKAATTHYAIDKKLVR